jgi:hypothetical protein
MQNHCDYSAGACYAIHPLDLTKSMLLTSLSTNVPSLVPVDNPNTTQTPEYTKDKYNAKIIK